MRIQKNIIVGVVVLLGLSGCSSKGLYNMAASHQCQRDVQHQPDPNTAHCSTQDTIDGRTYEEYEHERQSSSN